VFLKSGKQFTCYRCLSNKILNVIGTREMGLHVVALCLYEG
jgi:hypothetical protein